MIYMIRGGIVLLTVVSGFMTGMLLAIGDEGLSTIIPGVTTLLGLSALIWKLVTDRRADQQMDGRYDDLLKHYLGEIRRKDDELLAARTENATLAACIAVLESALAKGQGGTT